ncbi:unnamed protein product, partial [Polarella glacialis]
MALEAALRKQYGSQVSVQLVDFIRLATPWPWNASPEAYQALGQFPSVYKRVWDHDQSSETWHDTSTFSMIWTFCRESILTFLVDAVGSGVDLIISVHPLIHHLVLEGLGEIFEGQNRGRKHGGRQKVLAVPVVTVVTDLGSAHLSWFDPRVHMLFVPSKEILDLALKYNVPRKKIHLCGLPVREGFWSAIRPELGVRNRLQEQLGLRPTDRPEVILLMGGGEGFGKLVDVATAIGNRLSRLGFGQMVVVCGRNEEVRKELTQRTWPARREGEWTFTPVILGFVSNIDEYMTAADCLVTK